MNPAHKRKRIRPVHPLRRVLWTLGETQGSLAEQLGVGRQAVVGWCQGKGLSPKNHRALARWLRERGVSIDDIALEVRVPPPKLRLVHEVAAEEEDLTNPANPIMEADMPRHLSRDPLTDAELQYWGLQADPFDDGESPEDVWMPPYLARVAAALERAIMARQILALVGTSGSGKSTLLRRLYAQRGGDKRIRLIAPAALDRAKITPAVLAVAILRDLTGRDTSSMGQEARSELLRATLRERDEAGEYPVLVIDEAHDLSASALIAIKRIWDSHLLFRQLGVILVGQPGLADRLRKDSRVAEVHGRARIAELAPLSEQATRTYIKWRFARVNGPDPDELFAADAWRVLALSGQHPLWINNLAAASMREAYRAKERPISGALIGSVQ